MGFSLTSPAPEKGDPTAENRVWGFFGDAQQSHRENRPQSLQPRQGNRLSLTKTVSGRTYWPSRDPIGERGGMNLYGMVGNDAVGRFDFKGLTGWQTNDAPQPEDDDRVPSEDAPLRHFRWVFQVYCRMAVGYCCENPKREFTKSFSATREVTIVETDPDHITNTYPSDDPYVPGSATVDTFWPDPNGQWIQKN